MGMGRVAGALVCLAQVSARAALIVDLQPSPDWVTGHSNLDRDEELSSGDFDGEGDGDDSRAMVPFSTTESLTENVLAGVAGARVSWFQAYDLEPGYDYGHLSILDTNLTVLAENIYEANGFGALTWTQQQVTLPAGAVKRLRRPDLDATAGDATGRRRRATGHP
jgi:hypothetical protein